MSRSEFTFSKSTENHFLQSTENHRVVGEGSLVSMPGNKLLKENLPASKAIGSLSHWHSSRKNVHVPLHHLSVLTHFQMSMSKQFLLCNQNQNSKRNRNKARKAILPPALPPGGPVPTYHVYLIALSFVFLLSVSSLCFVSN